VGLADAISLRSRRRKLALFLELMQPTAETTVLDVGVDEVSHGESGGESGCTTHNFLEEHYPWPARITALGLHEGGRFRERYPAIRYVQGDACDLPFADGAFDVVHSNAVIEHVGGRERQEAFVREAVRVGKRVFLTTPNRWFPVEVHTRLPFVHWLPEAAAGRVYHLVRKPWARENQLLGPGELRALFPVPVRVHNLGMTLVATT
jgi:SAM-dependent methyltransferase